MIFYDKDSLPVTTILTDHTIPFSFPGVIPHEELKQTVEEQQKEIQSLRQRVTLLESILYQCFGENPEYQKLLEYNKNNLK